MLCKIFFSIPHTFVSIFLVSKIDELIDATTPDTASIDNPVELRCKRICQGVGEPLHLEQFGSGFRSGDWDGDDHLIL
jgi:hypothetical protein